MKVLLHERLESSSLLMEMEEFKLFNAKRSALKEKKREKDKEKEKEKGRKLGTPIKTISSILAEDEEIRALKKKEKQSELQKTYFCDERFELHKALAEDRPVGKWRTKQRVRITLLDSDSQVHPSFHKTKTVGVALVVCLNIGVDPPDVIKTSPCARLECWIGKIFTCDR